MRGFEGGGRSSLLADASRAGFFAISISSGTVEKKKQWCKFESFESIAQIKAHHL